MSHRGIRCQRDAGFADDRLGLRPCIGHQLFIGGDGVIGLLLELLRLAEVFVDALLAFQKNRCNARQRRFPEHDVEKPKGNDQPEYLAEKRMDLFKLRHLTALP